MNTSNWTKAIFRGKSSYLGWQQGETYTIQVRTPGMFYPFLVLSQELEGCTTEYLDFGALRQEWQYVEPAASPPVGPLGPQAHARVLRGKRPAAGTTVQVLAEDADQPGFWWCAYREDTAAGPRERQVLLSAGQLQVLGKEEDGA